jgi:hypothetical protein
VSKRVIAFGDAWFPIRAGDDDFMIDQIEQLRREAADAGRGAIPVTLQVPPKEPERLERYEQAGVTRCVHLLRPSDATDPASAERKLDEWAGRVREYAS